MTNHEIDLAISEIHDSVKQFLGYCPNASLRSVADSVAPQIEEKYKANHHEAKKIRAEIGRAYDYFTKKR